MIFYPLTEPEQIRIYRLDNGLQNLANTNAGNLFGVLSYLELADERMMATGDYLSLFEVIVKEGYGEYIEFTGGRSRTSKNIGSFVGRKQKTPLIWYSFPFGGKWDLVRKIGSLPLSEVYTCLDSQQKSREEMTDEEEIILIEDLIAQKYPDS